MHTRKKATKMFTTQHRTTIPIIITISRTIWVVNTGITFPILILIRTITGTVARTKAKTGSRIRWAEIIQTSLIPSFWRCSTWGLTTNRAASTWVLVCTQLPILEIGSPPTAAITMPTIYTPGRAIKAGRASTSPIQIKTRTTISYTSMTMDLRTSSISMQVATTIAMPAVSVTVTTTMVVITTMTPKTMLTTTTTIIATSLVLTYTSTPTPTQSPTNLLISSKICRRYYGGFLSTA